MTVPDNTCMLRIFEDPKLGYKKENFYIGPYLPEVNKINCSIEEITLCFYSHLSLTETSKWYANPQCAKCIGETDLGNKNCLSEFRKDCITYTPHFRLAKSFDDNGNYDSVLTTGQPVCPWDQYFDIFSNQCKTKNHNICEKIITSDMNSTVPPVFWEKNIFQRRITI